MNLREKFNQMIELYEEIKHEVGIKDKYLYERWKAGGFLIDNDIISMYPALEEVVDIISPDDFGIDDEDDPEDDPESCLWR